MKRLGITLFKIIIFVLIALQVGASVRAYRSNKYDAMWQRCQYSDLADTEAYAYVNHFSQEETVFWMVVWVILACLVCRICWALLNNSWRNWKGLSWRSVFAFIARWTMRGVGVVYLLVGGGLIYNCLEYLYIQNAIGTKAYESLIRWSNRFADGNVYLLTAYFVLLGVGFVGIALLELYAAKNGFRKKYLYWPMLAVAALTCGFAAFFFLAIF